MPTTEHTEREERKLTVILYLGTIVMLVLLYASYANMRRYDAAIEEVKRYNNALLRIDNVLIVSRTWRPAFVASCCPTTLRYGALPAVRRNNAEHHLTVADSLLPEDMEVAIGVVTVGPSECR